MVMQGAEGGLSSWKLVFVSQAVCSSDDGLDREGDGAMDCSG